MINELMQKINYLHQQVSLIHRKTGNFIARGVLKLISVGSGNIYNVQGSFLAGETISDLQHPHQYGFISQAAAGASILALFNGGNRDHGQAIMIYDPTNAPSDLNSGDCCQYDNAGNRIWLKGADGILIKHGNKTITINDAGITIDAGGTPITLNGNTVINGTLRTTGTGEAGACTIAGSLTATGNVADATGSMAKMRGEYNVHKHNTPSGESDPTDTPMG